MAEVKKIGKKYLNNKDVIRFDGEDPYVLAQEIRDRKGDTNKSKKIDSLLISIDKALPKCIVGVHESERLYDEICNHCVDVIKICTMSGNGNITPIIGTVLENGQQRASDISPELWKIYNKALLTLSMYKQKMAGIGDLLSNIDQMAIIGGNDKKGKNKGGNGKKGKNKRSIEERLKKAYDRRRRASEGKAARRREAKQQQQG